MSSSLGVTELNAYVRKVLDLDMFLPRIRVHGELSNVTKHRNGHLYFSLVDSKSKIDGIFFDGAHDELFEEGDHVEVEGSISLYERQGRLQLVAQKITPLGEGQLRVQQLELKDRLAKEGLFLRERKRQLPRFAMNIGIITSPQGAALQDVLKVGRRCNSKMGMVIYPVAVQGEGAAQEIVKGLSVLGNRQDLDAILLVRGGGAQEDLSAFQEEEVVRAVANCPIPVVTGVGHEVDVNLVDFAADVSVPTPSAAAELVFGMYDEENQRLEFMFLKLKTLMAKKMESSRVALSLRGLELRLVAPAQILQRQKFHLQEHYTRMQKSFHYVLQEKREHLNACSLRLEWTHPKRRLERAELDLQKLERSLAFLGKRIVVNRRLSLNHLGNRLRDYAMTSPHHVVLYKGNPLTEMKNIAIGDHLDILFPEGKLEVTVTARKEHHENQAL